MRKDSGVGIKPLALLGILTVVVGVGVTVSKKVDAQSYGHSYRITEIDPMPPADRQFYSSGEAVGLSCYHRQQGQWDQDRCYILIKDR